MLVLFDFYLLLVHVLGKCLIENINLFYSIKCRNFLNTFWFFADYDLHKLLKPTPVKSLYIHQYVYCIYVSTYVLYNTDFSDEVIKILKKGSNWSGDILEIEVSIEKNITYFSSSLHGQLF